MQDATLVDAVGLSKSYAGVRALSNVSINFRAGEVHGLVGENGAGKSTFIKILGGTVRPDSGTVKVAGQQANISNVRDSESLGIAVVHQESSAFLDLSAEDNLMIGREPVHAGFLLDRVKSRELTQSLLDRVGARIPLGLPLAEVSLAQRQLVAIARSLSLNARLLILDEPSASLSNRETENLHKIVRQLRSEGVCVVYVSHRLDEICDLADRTTILRDGQVVGELGREETTQSSLIRAMVGRDIDQRQPKRQTSTSKDIVLKIQSLSREGSFEDVSFEVCKGEIVGLGGLVGAGRTEVARSLFGIDRSDSGFVAVKGKQLKGGSIQEAVNAGIAFVPEDRQHQGLVTEESVRKNLIIAARNGLARMGLIDGKAEAQVCKDQVSRLSIKTAGTSALASSLSGGNQQKIVFGKWLATNPDVLILDEPTRGVDVGSKAEIHSHVRQLAESGAAVLVISSDLPELLALSDRIVVMREGKVVGTLVGDEATEDRVLNLAFGAQG